MKISNILLCLLILLTSGCDSGNSEVIEADDNGSGKIVHVLVKPGRDQSQIMQDSDGNVFLKWLDTGLFISNESIMLSNKESNGYDSYQEEIAPARIGLSVRGVWYPWGMIPNIAPKQCTVIPCSLSDDYRCKLVPSSTMIVQNNQANDGCYLANGWGVYVLVAKPRSDGTYPDPNKNADVSISPSAADGFFTGHIGEFKPNQNGYINIDKLWSCDDNNGVSLCEVIDMKTVAKGKIYLKVVDSFYIDNNSSKSDTKGNQYITVNIKSGIYYPNFVSATLETMHDSLQSITNSLKNVIMDSFRDLVRVTILLYFLFTSLGFMIGLIKITQTEMIVRLLKIGIVVMLTTPYNTVSEYFVEFYDLTATFASNIIAANLPKMPYTESNASSEFGDKMSYLLIYDGILNQVISKQVNLKIISLLFTSMVWCIPLMYILIVIIIVIVLRSLLLYITAYVQMNILILILPIFAVMLLFKVTSKLFQDWLKYMANSVLLIIVATLGMGLCLGIINSVLSDLLNYSISKQNIWWFIWWWRPEDLNALYSHLNAESYLMALMISLICYSFVEQVPKLADALSDSQLSPSIQAFNALWTGAREMLDEGFSAIKNFNSQYLVGRLLDQRYKEDGEYVKDKEGKGILDKWKITRDKADNLFYKYIGSQYDKIDQGSIFSNSNINDKLKNQELNLLKSEQQYAGNDYQKMIDDRKVALDQELKNNDTLKNSVHLGEDANPISLSADNNNNIVYNGHHIAKDDIRAAISQGRNQINVGGNNVNLRSQYSKELHEKLNKRLEELGKIEEELRQIRKN